MQFSRFNWIRHSSLGVTFCNETMGKWASAIYLNKSWECLTWQNKCNMPLRQNDRTGNYQEELWENIRIFLEWSNHDDSLLEGKSVGSMFLSGLLCLFIKKISLWRKTIKCKKKKLQTFIRTYSYYVCQSTHEFATKNKMSTIHKTKKDPHFLSAKPNV